MNIIKKFFDKTKKFWVKIMKKINLGITGCLGKMGQHVIRSAKNNKKFNLMSLTGNGQ